MKGIIGYYNGASNNPKTCVKCSFKGTLRKVGECEDDPSSMLVDVAGIYLFKCPNCRVEYHLKKEQGVYVGGYHGIGGTKITAFEIIEGVK